MSEELSTSSENKQEATDRAKQVLASHAGAVSGDIIQLIVFKVGNEEYGLEIGKVQEVIRIKEIKHLPKTPDFILGVMNLRGNIIPVVGLREKFGLEKIDYTPFTRIIVVNHKGKLVGMIVDEVNRVVNVPVKNIEANPEMVSENTRALVRGVAKMGEEVIILVELDYLLYSVEEIQTLTQASEAKQA